VLKHYLPELKGQTSKFLGAFHIDSDISDMSTEGLCSG
jgi:hypothetical protein